MDDDVPILARDVDKGDSAVKLSALKKRLKNGRVVDFFKNPEDLRGLVFQILIELKKQFDDTTTYMRIFGEVLSRNLHYVSAVPNKPEPYIAHPYTLLQVKGLIGRKAELDMLTEMTVDGKQESATCITGIG